MNKTKNMPTKETYNNGKDLMPHDIFVEEGKDLYGSPVFNAYLALVPFVSSPLEGISLSSNPPKLYLVQGRTKKEAVNDLLSLLQEHLERLKT